MVMCVFILLVDTETLSSNGVEFVFTLGEIEVVIVFGVACTGSSFAGSDVAPGTII